ncbi:MAG: hypothetical protein ACOC06_06245 [Halorubrum sp.]
MVRLSDARGAAAEVSDDYVESEDPDGLVAERLVADETFGAIAVAYDQLRIERRYGELSEDVDVPISDAMGQLEDALAARASEVLEEGKE